MPIPGMTRMKWRSERLLIWLIGFVTLAISFANFCVGFFDFKNKGVWRNWRFWVTVASCLILLWYARQMFLLRNEF